MKYFTKIRALILVTVLSLASLGGYVGYDQLGIYQDNLRIEGGNNFLGAIRRNISQLCEAEVNYVLNDNLEKVTLTTEECVSADYFDIVQERGELILRSKTGANLLLVPAE